MKKHLLGAKNNPFIPNKDFLKKVLLWFCCLSFHYIVQNLRSISFLCVCPDLYVHIIIRTKMSHWLEKQLFEEKVAYFDPPIVLLHCGKYEKITWNRFWENHNFLKSFFHPNHLNKFIKLLAELKSIFLSVLILIMA